MRSLHLGYLVIITFIFFGLKVDLLKGLDDEVLKEMSPEKLAKILSQGAKNGTFSEKEFGEIINNLSNSIFESAENAAKVLDALVK